MRTYLSFDQLDSVADVQLVNQLYDQMWLHYNFFQLVLHTAEKTIVAAAGQRPHLRRPYDTAQTPFERLCAAKAITTERRQVLEQLRQQTNPHRLRREIYALPDTIAALPVANSPVNVCQAVAILAQPLPPPAEGNPQSHESTPVMLGHANSGQAAALGLRSPRSRRPLRFAGSRTIRRYLASSWRCARSAQRCCAGWMARSAGPRAAPANI